MNVDKEDLKEKYEGLELKTKYGTPFVVKEYIESENVIIEFPFSGIQKNTRVSRMMADPPEVGDPFYSRGKHKPFVFENPQEEFIGLVFQNGYGEKYKIVEYNNSNDVTVEFLDEHKHRVKTDYRNVKRGTVGNPYRINFAGGYVGEGNEYSGSEYGWLNRTWHDVLIRANRKDKMHAKNRYSYDNTKVSPEWLNYSNFTRDYMNKLLPLNPAFNYSIDKDLLYDKYKDKTDGYKYYSNETTVLLPMELNSGVERIVNNKLMVQSTTDYNYRYQRLLDWKDKVTWYWNNNGISELAYVNLLELADNKLEEMRQKFPEFEQRRLEKESQ